MPYSIIETDDGQYCVYKDGDEEPMHCYLEKGDAHAYWVALTLAMIEEEKNDPAMKQSYIPPVEVAENARLALEVRESKPESQRGMTAVGLARAHQLASRSPVSLETIRRMISYFARHEVDKQGGSWEEQGPGWQAWYGWGGDEGRDWALEVLAEYEEEMTEAEEEVENNDESLDPDLRFAEIKNETEPTCSCGQCGRKDTAVLESQPNEQPTEVSEEVKAYVRNLLRRMR
jgi:hypothetical protein